jgi:hypothetical protein
MGRAKWEFPDESSCLFLPGTVVDTRFCVTLFLRWTGLAWPSRSPFTADFIFTYRVLLPLFLVKLNDEKNTFYIYT